MREKVFEILEDICEEDLRDTPDVNIFEEGLMDSLGLVRFIVEVEEQDKKIYQIGRNELNKTS